jgi:hypothetical protein
VGETPVAGLGTTIALTAGGTGDGTAVVQATSTSTADAEASGGSGGGVSVNVFLPSATVNGTTRAFVGEGASVTAVAVDVLADAIKAEAMADSLSLRFSGFGGSGVETQATVGRTVDAESETSMPGCRPAVEPSVARAPRNDSTVPVTEALASLPLPPRPLMLTYSVVASARMVGASAVTVSEPALIVALSPT